MTRSLPAAPPAHPATSRVKRTAVAVACAAVVALAVLALVLVPRPGAASAASYGPGFDDADNGGYGRIGAYLVEGRKVYCLEPLLDRPIGATTAAGAVGAAAFGVTPGVMAAVNWAISTHGQSDDPIVTSAVAVFVWSTVAADDLAAIDASDETRLLRVPEPHRGAVGERLDAIRIDAEAVAASSDAPFTGELELVADAADASHGTLAVRSSEATASAAVVLEGAVFASGANSADLAAGEIVPIRIDGEHASREDTTVRATATLTSGNDVWRPVLASFKTPGAQLLGGAGGSDRPSIDIEAEDITLRTPPFAPIVETEVESRTVEVGSPFVDLWTPRLFDGAWPRGSDGTYAELLASATLYGPFDVEPARSAEPPAGAPVAATLTTSLGGGTDDPTGRTVSVSTGDLARPVLAEAPGYYVWIVEIAADRQGEGHPLPDAYVWRDDFGVPSEIALVESPTSTAPSPTLTPEPTSAPPGTPTSTPTPTPTPTASPTATPTPSATPTTSVPVAPPPPPADTTGAGAGTPATDAPPATDEAGAEGLAETGGRGDLDWLAVTGVVLVSGGCLIAATAIKRADARADMRREAARR